MFPGSPLGRCERMRPLGMVLHRGLLDRRPILGQLHGAELTGDRVAVGVVLDEVAGEVPAGVVLLDDLAAQHDVPRQAAVRETRSLRIFVGFPLALTGSPCRSPARRSPWAGGEAGAPRYRG